MAPEGQRFPTPGSAGHYDLDTLALLDADAFEPAVAAAVHAHVATCAECRAALVALGSVRAALADLPTPRVPPAVAANLDAALDAERRTRFGLTAVPGPGGDPGSTARLGDLGAARQRRRRHAVLGWAAAAVVLLGGVGAGTALIASGSSDSRPEAQTTQPTHSPRTTPSGPQAPGGPDGQVGATDQTPDPAAPHQAPGGQAHGGQVTPHTLVPQYTRDDINARLGMIIAQANCDASGSCGAGSAGAMSDPDRRARCLAALDGSTGVTGNPRAVQFALFEGEPAYVFVFAGGRVVVVDTACGQSTSADVLFSTP